ncbi:MFS transporter [Ethanoligenens sp.]|uniref:MFS transporter n=1 Tax=Ethanoligenens sp. TaxID=2099655 RepID=UPI0039E8ED1B
MPYGASQKGNRTKPANRGRAIGTVMTGLLIGMLLSRTFSGIIGTHFGWQSVYRIAAGMIGVLIIVFAFCLPHTSPLTEK